MRFSKKEYMVNFGKYDPMLHYDQKELSEIYQKDLEECMKDNKKKKLSREDRLILYRKFEYDRIVKEKDKINDNIIKIGYISAVVILFITSLMYLNILNDSFILVNILFVINIFFTIYLYSKQNNVYDKLRDRELYLAILDIKKNINDLTNLIENIK